MSHQVSNLYAAKIFAEHPLGLWALDDDFAFQSILSTTYKDFDNWDHDNLVVLSASATPTGVPMPDDSISIVTMSAASLGISPSASSLNFTRNSLDTSKGTICISAYVYAFSNLISSYDIGFKYDSTEYFKTVFLEDEEVWQKIHFTNNIPSNNNINVVPFIRINYESGGPESSSDYNVAINGLSVGQWSEVFNSDTTGSMSATLTDSVLANILPSSGSAGISIVTADSYGISDSYNGYYIIDNKKMLATNSNLPMVFGSSNITNIRPPVSSGMPSVVIPGKGFLNSTGKYLEMTAEFWLRVYTQSANPIRIFGPVNSQDGLYVEEEFLTLRIGKYTKSYFIGKWYRPMLIDIRYTLNSATLLINGDLAFEMAISMEDTILPPSYYDYIGFFGHEEVYPFDIDCVAIYSYIVPEQVAKRRFIYGQGVDNPENIISNFDGESIYVDFPYAKYTSTINYPDMTGWNAGFFSNLNTTSKFLTFPQYSVPEIIFGGDVAAVFDVDVESRTWTEANERTWGEWYIGLWDNVRLVYSAEFYTDNYSIQDETYPFIKLRPNTVYDPVYPTIYFNSANPIDTPVKSIFGTFKSPDSLPTTEQVLMYFTNKVNSNTFKVSLTNNDLKYIFTSSSGSTLLENRSISASSNFVAGFDIDEITNNYNAVIGNFFSNPQNISLNLGGYEESVFDGKIYGLTFNNRLFTDKDLSSYIDQDGIFETAHDEYLFRYVGNYTMTVQTANRGIVLDVGVAGYWEDSVPLSYFGKLVQSETSTPYYDLDMIQFNIDYPSPLITSGSILNSTEDDFRIKTFITLQNFEEVGEIPYSNYTQTQTIGSSRVLDFDNTEDIVVTKFEVVDGTVIFPPKELVDFEEYYITTHLEARSRGIYSKPLLLKRMSLSSLAFDETDFYSIGTRTGNEIYPFTRYDSNYSYKDKNPFVIYKESTPYLYLTGDSGISILDYESNADRGISIPINQQKSSDYLLGGVQIWMFYNQSETINDTVKIARITSIDRTVDIYLIPETSSNRAKIAAYDPNTGIQDFDAQFYQNGVFLENPYIEPLSWNSIVIAFGTSLDLDSYTGQLELYKGFLFNNIGLYKKSTDILGTTIEVYSWQDFRQVTTVIDGESVPVLQTWQSKMDNIWSDFPEEVIDVTYTIDGRNIYESYLGLSKAVSDDTSTLLINSDGINILTNVTWNEYSGRPV